MRFLIVDDEPDVLVLVKANVRRWGHEAITADSLDEARRVCHEEPPDVLILDVTMPGMDGPTFLRSLREEGAEPPRTYLLSAIPPDRLTELASALGVGHVSKPFTAAGLREQLAEALEADV